LSASELQACLARLYTNSAFRRLFRDDPDAALVGYFLNPAERDAVTGIDSAMLEWFASSLKVKRRERLQRSFTALFAMGSPALDAYYDRYHEIYPLRPGETGGDDAAQFAEFIEETIADGEHLPPYARDLVRFERTLEEVRQSVRAAPPVPADRPAAEDFPQRPRVRAGVQVARFDWNVTDIDDALREGREPEERKEDEIIVYALREGDREPKVMRVSEPTAVVIDLCDGGRSVADVVAAVEEYFDQRGLRVGVEDAIRHLADSGILEEADGAAT
jgi:hypothetical protein